MADPAGTKLPENRIHLFDPIGLINETYLHHGVRASRATTSYDGSAGTSGGGALRFAVEPKAESDSGGSPLCLWKLSSPPHHSQPMCPNSRTQAIARGRRELMDMIKDVPESFYELSLKDIVEHKPPSPPPPPPLPPPPPPPAANPPQQSNKVEAVEKKFEGKKKGSRRVGKSESKKKMVRNRSIDNGGFLLKTSVCPFPFRSRKKRSLNPAASFKVAPKPPPPPPTSKGAAEGAEKDWWGRKSDSESGGHTSGNSESARSSTSSSRSSNSSRHRQRNRFLPSCCSFFSDKRIKPKK